MTRFLLLAVLGLACALPGSPARAVGPSVFFVSANGSDSNGCTASAPCLTVNHVLTLSPPAGSEIDCIIPGNIINTGGITLTNSITINCLGGVASGPLNVNTSGTVTLRGIHVQGLGTSGDGIAFGGGGTLSLDNVVVERFGDAGLAINSGGNVSVINSKFTNCSPGILILPSSASVFVSLSHVTAENNENGIVITDGDGGKSEVNLVDSVVTSNSNDGVEVLGSGTGNPLQFLTVQRSSLVMNGVDGLVASGPNTFVLIGESSVAWNRANGIESQSNGLVFSYRNNQVNGNGMNDLVGTVSTAGLQ